MCTLRSLLKCPSRARAPSFGAASTALVLLRPAGRRCTQTRELRVCQGEGECVLPLQRQVGCEVGRARGRLH
eukprot:1811718-Alexandrium_andersonii.AAC.1